MHVRAFGRSADEHGPLPIVLCGLALRPNGAGVSTYIRQLVSALPRHFDGPTDVVVQADMVASIPSAITTRERSISSGVRRAIEGLRNPGPARLVHGLDVDLPALLHCPSVTTVHDLSVFDVPWAISRRRKYGERLLVERAIRRADAVITVSQFTANRVLERFGRESVVTTQAPSPDLRPAEPDRIEAVRRAHELPDRFVLHVGSVEPRKDLGRLAEACRSIDIPLVLAGARMTAPPAGAVVLGFVPSGEIPALYGSATVVAYTSIYEGFGLPPLEAMACGAPVVATPVPSLVECVPEAAELVPMRSPEKLAAVLADLLQDDERRLDLAERGLSAVSRLSWDDTAAGTVGVYRSLGV